MMHHLRQKTQNEHKVSCSVVSHIVIDLFILLIFYYTVYHNYRYEMMLNIFQNI